MDQFFSMSHNGSTYRKETTAGLSSSLTMSFIVAVNSMFLADSGFPLQQPLLLKSLLLYLAP